MEFNTAAELAKKIDDPRLLEMFRASRLLSAGNMDIGVEFLDNILDDKFHGLKGLLPGIVHRLRSNAALKYLKYSVALASVLDEYKDLRIRIAVDYNRRVLGNVFPNEGLWFIQDIGGERFCYHHPNTQFVLNKNSTVLAGLGNQSINANQRALRYR